MVLYRNHYPDKHSVDHFFPCPIYERQLSDWLGMIIDCFMTRLLDSHLYYKANGLGIEWYTPNFGGGLPAYPNPLQMQFSLPQLVTWFVNPYAAIFISTAIYIAIGFLVTYLFLNKCIEIEAVFGNTWSRFLSHQRISD